MTSILGICKERLERVEGEHCNDENEDYGQLGEEDGEGNELG